MAEILWISRNCFNPFVSKYFFNFAIITLELLLDFCFLLDSSFRQDSIRSVTDSLVADKFVFYSFLNNFQRFRFSTPPFNKGKSSRFSLTIIYQTRMHWPIVWTNPLNVCWVDSRKQSKLFRIPECSVQSTLNLYIPFDAICDRLSYFSPRQFIPWNWDFFDSAILHKCTKTKKKYLSALKGPPAFMLYSLSHESLLPRTTFHVYLNWYFSRYTTRHSSYAVWGVHTQKTWISASPFLHAHQWSY